MEEGGKLIKAAIHIYEKKTFQGKKKTIFLPVNPESFSRNLKIENTEQQGQGNQGTNPDYKVTAPEELKLDFIMDGTETIEDYVYNGSDHSVKGQLDIFLNSVYTMNSNTHRPNFLIVQWGDISFQCVLKNIDLNYTLFKSNGDPLRVKVSATFLKYIEQRERTIREGKKSPDLTHIKQVKAGDRLDNMTNSIYNNPKYLTQIARINNLTSFRRIKPGDQLLFPPLDKTVAN
ncbi:CIS tube protein [Aquimarina agarivorans]|uniref:CIS tube protein n=1 Tax=Aquimarina agarivorans TaxID=980584 RepID=UPI000248EFEC|nr:hypothetical protein [Aquimarina agarivorans]